MAGEAAPGSAGARYGVRGEPVRLMRDDGAHIAMPRDGTWVSRHGEPADMRRPDDYPLTARCNVCGGPIGLERLWQMEWRHVPPGTAGSPATREVTPVPMGWLYEKVSDPLLVAELRQLRGEMDKLVSRYEAAVQEFDRRLETWNSGQEKQPARKRGQEAS